MCRGFPNNADRARPGSHGNGYRSVHRSSSGYTWSASASIGADGVITVAVDSAGQSIKVSVKMVYVADPNKVYSMGTIGTWTTGNYRFEPSCPGDSGEYSIRFYDQNGHLLTSVNATL